MHNSPAWLCRLFSRLSPDRRRRLLEFVAWALVHAIDATRNAGPTYRGSLHRRNLDLLDRVARTFLDTIADHRDLESAGIARDLRKEITQ